MDIDFDNRWSLSVSLTFFINLFLLVDLGIQIYSILHIKHIILACTKSTLLFNYREFYYNRNKNILCLPVQSPPFNIE